MNINALMQQAQKMQKEMTKLTKELEAKSFTVSSAGGAIEVVIKGTKRIESIKIDEDAIDPSEKEMLEDMIKIAINEALEVVEKEFEKINNQMTGGMKGFGF